MTNSSKRLLFLVASITALLLSFAPASFAGEDDDPGPTQAGEVQGPSAPSPATESGPSGSSGSGSGSSGSGSGSHSTKSSSNKSSGGVLAETHTVAKTNQDTTRARGGVQAGFGGMAGESSSLSMTLAFAGGILLLLAASAGYVPLRRRSQS